MCIHTHKYIHIDISNIFIGNQMEKTMATHSSTQRCYVSCSTKTCKRTDNGCYLWREDWV